MLKQVDNKIPILLIKIRFVNSYEEINFEVYPRSTRMGLGNNRRRGSHTLISYNNLEHIQTIYQINH